MKTKFLYFTKICFFIYLLLTFIQLSFASFKGELKLDRNKIKLSAITYKVFEKEFIFTNSTTDYYRTLKRLILNYNIDVKGTTMMNLLSEGSAVDINIDLITLNTWLYYILPPAVKINSNDDDDKKKDAMPAVASSSTLIHIPKGCIKLLVCEHGNSEDSEDRAL